MSRTVKAGTGQRGLALPNGKVISDGQTTVLSDSQWAQVSALVSSGALIDMGSTTASPDAGYTGESDVTALAALEAYKTQALLRMPVLAPIKAALDEGLRTFAIGTLGDSTGNDTTDWFYRMAQKVAPMYPVFSVHHRLFSDTTQQLGAATVIQTGTAGDQYLDCVADAALNTLLAPGKHPASGNLDIRIKLASSNWASNPALANLASRSGVSGQYSHWINYTTGRTIQFVYSTTGANTLTATSTAAVPFTGTQTGWIRVVAIGNNGTQAEFRFYTSTDGVTWTQLGTTVNATSYTLFDGGFSFEFGGRGVLNFPGKIYETEYRDGENGPLMAPSLPGLYGPNPLSTADATVRGAPILTFVNGSVAGAGLTYLNDTTRLPKMLPDYGQMAIFTSCSHNEATSKGPAWTASYQAWLDKITSLMNVPLVPLTQNPEQTSAANYVAHGRRRLQLLGLRNVIDTYKIFVDYGPTMAADLMADTIHPNATGSDMWRDAVLNRILASYP